MTWTNDELQQLDAIRYRKAAARAFRAVCTGLALVVAIRAGWGYGAGAWLIGLAVAQCLEPEMPPHLITRAQQIDNERGAQ